MLYRKRAQIGKVLPNNKNLSSLTHSIAMAKTRWMEHEEPRSQDIKDEILRLLLMLKQGECICPTEAARAFGSRWRQFMPEVTEVVADMARDEIIEVTLHGVVIDVDERELSTVKGPIRLRLLSRLEG